jgi:serine/threonine-protein kinase
MTRYTRIREIGRGGMGTVYLGARDLPGGPQAVALKTLPDDRRHRAYAERGARLAMEWRHPALAAVFDVDDGHIVMEWIDGIPAGRAAALSPMPPPVLRAVLLAVRSAAGELHRGGVVHRDIKPDNIMLSRTGRIVLIDYDLVSAGAAGSTIAPAYKGTPAYSSPEQLAGADIGPEADSYSLAAAAYHLVTGQPPYGRGDAGVIRGRLAHDTPPALPATLPDDLADWIMVGLRLRAGEPVLTGPVASAAEVAAYVDALPLPREVTELAHDLAAPPPPCDAAPRPPRFSLSGAASSAAACAMLVSMAWCSTAVPSPQSPALAPAPVCPKPPGPQATCTAPKLVPDPPDPPDCCAAVVRSDGTIGLDDRCPQQWPPAGCPEYL